MKTKYSGIPTPRKERSGSPIVKGKSFFCIYLEQHKQFYNTSLGNSYYSYSLATLVAFLCYSATVKSAGILSG